MAVLESAIPIDRAFTEHRRQRQLAQGWPADRVALNGNVNLYLSLGESYRRLREFTKALEAFEYMHRLARRIKRPAGIWRN